jgi:UDP-N-acetylmuramoylalanine--D-glutamate ligase
MRVALLQAKANKTAQQRTLIVGLGETGLSVARFLASRGVPIAVTDSRVQPPALDRLREEMPDAALFLGGFDRAAFEAAQQLIVSPGVSLKEPAIAEAMRRGVPVLGDIELFARHADAPVIAITGSNGKSTVTTLVGEMAAAAGFDARVGGNLGTPALDLLLAAQRADAVQRNQPALYVLELSSFQLETTSSLRARAAVVLNISADHMDRYDSLQEYAAAKQRIYARSEVMVINADDPLVTAMLEPRRRVVRFGLREPADEQFYGIRTVDDAVWLARGNQNLIDVRELRIRGQHNWANALAALALGDAAGMPMGVMLDTLRDFTGLPHRMQWVGEAHGVTWYDDSKGTNVGATLAALSGAPGRVVLIAGGEGKGQDFAPLRDGVAGKARAVVLIGRDAALIEAALGGVVPVVHAQDMDDAVAKSRELAQPGDCVLLSPACASFDMFRNYAHRGEVFAQAARRWLP